jgi:serine/threonine protein kinase
LPPALNALAFLHSNDLVHGHLKPSNILAVEDRLKLSSDTVRPTGHAASGVVRTSLYDPPELSQGSVVTGGDIWALGMTLVEALSQRTWKGARGQGETTTSLLSSLPMPFQETARKCLSRAPADRPTVAELEAQYGPVPQDELISVAVISTPQSSEREEPRAGQATERTGGPLQDITDMSGEAAAQPPQSLANLSLRAVVLALLLFLSAWMILRS